MFSRVIGNQIMKLIVLAFLLSVFVGPCAAQEKCDFNFEKAPVLLNLKLQMSPQEAQSVLGRGVKVKIKKNGQRTFFQNFIKNPAPPLLNGVRALYLRFFDRRLYQIEIFYENRSKWQTLEDFTKDLAPIFETSAVSWQKAPGKRILNCAGTTLIVDKVLNPRIEVTDEKTRRKVEDIRQQESKED